MCPMTDDITAHLRVPAGPVDLTAIETDARATTPVRQGKRDQNLIRNPTDPVTP